MNQRILVFLILFLSKFYPSQAIESAKIGLCIVATGKYIHYADTLIQSARNYFCTNQSVTYFVFTDQPFKESSDIKVIYQPRLGWPKDTLLRFEVYYKNRKILKEMDYLFAVDADMLFISKVGEEILSDLVATQHPGFVGQRGSYETKKKSTACVRKHEGKQYFCGGFYGGSSKEFLRLCKYTTKNIYLDLKKNYIAVWHDESHINRYFIDHPPTKILSPSYCYPESWTLPYEKKLLALDKNHSEMRK